MEKVKLIVNCIVFKKLWFGTNTLEKYYQDIVLNSLYVSQIFLYFKIIDCLCIKKSHYTCLWTQLMIQSINHHTKFEVLFSAIGLYIFGIVRMIREFFILEKNL